MRKINLEKIDLELIKKLSEAFGVSGRENEVRDILRAEIEPFCDSVRRDPLGSLIAEKDGADPILLMTAMDEPGFIVTNVKEGGGAFLDFAAVGAVKSHSVISQAVVVGEKKLPGIISLKAVHLTTKEEREKPAALKDLYIDIGADTKSDAEKNVMIGDCAAFKSAFAELGENQITGKALMRSVCCAVLAELLKRDFGRGVTCVFTAQKQTGLRGSKTSLGLDETKYAAAFTLDCIEDERAKLGEGVAAPSVIGETCADESAIRSLRKAAEKAGKLIPFAKKNSAGDISSVSVRGEGIRCAELDIPIRNKNTASEIVDKRDILAAYETLINLLETE